MNTYSQRKQFSTNAAKELAADIKAIERENRERRLAAIKRHETDHALEGTITRDQLKTANYVRDKYGWWRISRLNMKTVTVDDDPDDRRIPIDKIRAIR